MNCWSWLDDCGFDFDLVVRFLIEIGQQNAILAYHNLRYEEFAVKVIDILNWLIQR